jgi:hypothetical protein
MRGRYVFSLLLFIVLFLLAACNRDRYRVNITREKVDIEIKRLEKDLFTTDPAVLKDSLPAIITKYGEFLRYFSYVIKTGEITDSLFGDYLTAFCTDKLNNEVFAKVEKAYPDLRVLEGDLEKAFRFYRHYFPGNSIPAVFTCITGFNRSIITADSVLGISLDRYLGRNCEYYPRLEIYGYLAARMNDYNIVPDCIYAWGVKLWDFEEMGYEKDNVLTEMIHEGKLRYFQKCMLPELNDTLLFGFTAGQMRFCLNNEDQMWDYLLKNDLLFSTDQFTIRKLTGEAPFTSYFTRESPGRAAVWIGFRIIESFMEKNSDVSLSEMIVMNDIQAILDGAKYDPR